MTAHILVEGDSDEAVLKAILPETKKGVRYWSSQGSGSMLSLARSLIASGMRGVAVILDSDTWNEDAVEERRENARKLLAMVGDEGDDWTLILLVPEIEELLLRDPAVLKSLGTSHEALKRVERTQRNNRREVFRRLLSRNHHTLETWLQRTNLTHLREGPPLDSLRSFLSSHGVAFRNGTRRTPRAR